MSDFQTAAEGVQASWADLVHRIQTGDASAMEELYQVFSTGVRFQLCRQLGPTDLDDRVHDVFLAVTQSIRNGDLREPERLMGFVQTVARRHVAAQIDATVQSRRRYADVDSGIHLIDAGPDPERQALAREDMELAMRVLNGISKRDREVLIRFYLKEQTAPEICREMELTETQFRLIKSRAKARFGELGKSRLARKTGFSRC